MKKTLLVFLSLLIIFPLFAWQENYRQSSDEVQVFYTLRRLSGTSTPEPTFPVSADQLLTLVKSLDNSSFGDVAKAKYEALVSELTNPKAVLSYKDINYDMKSQIVLFQYSKSDIDSVFYRYKDKPAILAVENIFNFSPYFTGMLDLNLSVSPDYYDETKNIFTLYQSWAGLTNEGHYCELYMHIPDRAYASVGFNRFNFTAGRDRVAAGNSFTGNLELSENFSFEDYLKASFVGDIASFDTTIIDFNEDDSVTNTLTNPRKIFAIHRLSGSFYDHFTVTLSEGAMAYTGSILSNAMVYNPFMVVHDWFSFQSGNTNNFFSAEIEGNYKGFEVSLQYFFDQINNRFEDNGNGKNANGLLINASYTTELWKGILTTYAEYAYTSPLCYLKETTPEYNAGEWKNKNDLLDLYTGITRIWGSNPDELSSIGYPYGTDVRVFALGAKYLFEKQEATANINYIVKGPMGAGTNEQRAADLAPLEGFNFDTTMLRANIGIKGSVHECVDYKVKLGFNIANNVNHVESNDKNGIELTFALSVDPTVFIPRH